MTDKVTEDKGLLDSLKLIVSKEGRLNDQLKNGKGLQRYAKDLLLLFSLVKDYYQGNYRDIPYKTISAAVVGLLYVINPIDIIPDFIPFIGQVDDALVLGFCLKLIQNDLLKYKTWKDGQTGSTTNVSENEENSKDSDEQDNSEVDSKADNEIDGEAENVTSNEAENKIDSETENQSVEMENSDKEEDTDNKDSKS